MPKKSLYVHQSSSEEEECESVKLSFCFFNKSIKGVWYFEICKCIKYHWLGNFGFVCLFSMGGKIFLFTCFVGEFGKLTFFFWYCFVKCLYLSKLFVTHFAVINNLLYNSVSGHLCVCGFYYLFILLMTHLVVNLYTKHLISQIPFECACVFWSMLSEFYDHCFFLLKFQTHEDRNLKCWNIISFI